MMVKLHPDLPSDILTGIAKVVVAWGHLEHVLALTIKRTSTRIDLAEAVETVRELCTLGRITERVRASFQIFARDQAQEARLEQMLERAVKLARARNDVVHGLWCRDESDNPRWLRLRVEYRISPDELLGVGREITALVAEINALTRPDFVKWTGEEWVSEGSPQYVEQVECTVSGT